MLVRDCTLSAAERQAQLAAVYAADAVELYRQLRLTADFNHPVVSGQTSAVYGACTAIAYLLGTQRQTVCPTVYLGNDILAAQSAGFVSAPRSNTQLAAV